MLAVSLVAVPLCATALLVPSKSSPSARPPPDIGRVYADLLDASELLEPSTGRCMLSGKDVQTALTNMHLQDTNFLPNDVCEATSIDVTELVTRTLPRVLEAHPIFAFMAEQTVGNNAFFKSVYFGTTPRTADALDFAALCRRVVASIYLFELLLDQDRDSHMRLARHYESRLAKASAAAPAVAAPRSLRHALMGAFLALKGESVLASINTFEMLRRLHGCQTWSSRAATGPTSSRVQREARRLGDLLNAIMRLNIVEAVLSNLSFAFWPDNARAGMALLRTPLGRFRADLSQELDREWFELYLAWNANFIWPSHYCDDMMAFTMLLTPTIALGPPERFQYHRAHSLFWVVRSTQLTRLSQAAGLREAHAEGEQLKCFHCRQLEPAHDRQPLTSRTAVLTRASGEQLARKYGEDVSDGSGVWWQLATEVVPEQLASLSRLYRMMPKVGPFKLRLL